MSEWVAGTTVLPLNFNITLVPGSSVVQAAAVTYEMVLPSGRRVGPFERKLDLAQVQAAIDSASAAIVGQLLMSEGVASVWEAPPP